MSSLEGGGPRTCLCVLLLPISKMESWGVFRAPPSAGFCRNFWLPSAPLRWMNDSGVLSVMGLDPGQLHTYGATRRGVLDAKSASNPFSPPEAYRMPLPLPVAPAPPIEEVEIEEEEVDEEDIVLPPELEGWLVPVVDGV